MRVQVGGQESVGFALIEVQQNNACPIDSQKLNAERDGAAFSVTLHRTAAGLAPAQSWLPANAVVAHMCGSSCGTKIEPLAKCR